MGYEWAASITVELNIKHHTHCKKCFLVRLQYRLKNFENFLYWSQWGNKIEICKFFNVLRPNISKTRKFSCEKIQNYFDK